MAAPRSLADRYRAGREAFTLALELGCTPAQARAELDRRQALANLQQTMARAGKPPCRQRPATTPTQAYAAQQRLLGERD